MIAHPGPSGPGIKPGFVKEEPTPGRFGGKQFEKSIGVHWGLATAFWVSQAFFDVGGRDPGMIVHGP